MPTGPGSEGSSGDGPPSSPSTLDDRILAPTRWVSVIIIPVLATAFVLLFGFPDRTDRLWAWTIRPEMTAVFMGAGYLAGCFFFVRVVRGRQWHRVGAGFVAITVFATMLLGATLLHWDRFNHDHVSFWAWLALYVATPPLLPWLWLTNRRTEPRRAADDPTDRTVRVPPWLRWAAGGGGVLTLLAAALLYISPSVLADAWPWPISDLTARTLAAFIAVPGVAWLWFVVDERWSALEIVQQVVAIGLVLILVGSIRSHESFRSGRLAPYLGGLAVALALELALLVMMRRREPRAEPAP